jgi:hypothetical protein
MRCEEIDDGTQAVSITLTAERLRAWQEQLTATAPPLRPRRWCPDPPTGAAANRRPGRVGRSAPVAEVLSALSANMSAVRRTCSGPARRPRSCSLVEASGSHASPGGATGRCAPAKPVVASMASGHHSKTRG